MASHADREVLPANVVPTHYDLKLRPQLQEAVFTGEETITIKVVQETSTIAVNANELEIQSAKVVVNGESLEASNIALEKDAERAILTFAKPVPIGTHQLHIVFSGILNNKMAGFYRSEYTTASGEKRNMATTQFEATDARRAFPCWDEPAVKATFHVTLNVPVGRVALSNMNVISEKPVEDGARVEVEFATTPIMSTYLVAFIIGELDYVEDVTKEGVKVRVYTPVGESARGHFALGVATKTLSFFTEYFAEPYPLPKMDLVAIPDFAAGAMENWGLVTYRTVYLLYDEGKSSFKAKQNIAYIVGHELAHQWFGNLVTMEWWTHLWLNEGFATWVGWLAVDHLFPEWDIWTQFLISEQNHGLKLDSLRSSHPIEVDVKSPGEINQIFDAISYSKGASVIRMLVHFLGSETFVKGLRAYLQKHKYANATTGDLWAALSQASGIDVSAMMTSWTKQVGYPVLDVESHGHIHQCRFLLSGDVTADEKKSLWWVPLSLKGSTGKDVLTTHDGAATFDLSAGFVKYNYGQSGFYRVKYDKPLLAELGKAVASKQLGPSDRVGIIGDAFALAFAGHQSTTEALSLILNYKNDDSFVVWDDISSSLGNLRSVWYNEDPKVVQQLKNLAIKLYGPIAHQLGWIYHESDSYSVTQLRSLAISVAGRAGDAQVVAQANEHFAKFIAGDDSAIHPNLRGPTMSIVVVHGGLKEFEDVLNIYRTTALPDLKNSALVALGLTQDTALIERAIAFAVSDEVRSQDVIHLFGALGSNFKARLLLWKYVQANWTTLHKRYVGTFLLGRVVTASTEPFSSEEMAQSIEAFFSSQKPEDLTSIDRTIRQSLETVKSNIKWITRDRAAVAAWLNEHDAA